MAYLERKIDKFLADWKSRPDRKPLIVKGARQIGKTESIKRFAESAYGSVVYINFLEKPIFGKIVSDGYSPDDIIRNITQIDGSLRFVPHETVIVFDEIQEYPDIATCFKFFCIDGRYDVIASGSLLGIHYRKIHSVSVGYQETFEMTSLDFEEFLRVDGKGAEFVDLLKSHMVEGRALPEVTMDVAGRVFMDYATVGGMPAVVERFAGTHNFSGITSMQREIVAAYRGDCGKYCEGLDAMKIRAVFDSVPGQLAKDYKKRFAYGREFFPQQAVEDGRYYIMYGGKYLTDVYASPDRDGDFPVFVAEADTINPQRQLWNIELVPETGRFKITNAQDGRYINELGTFWANKNTKPYNAEWNTYIFTKTPEGYTIQCAGRASGNWFVEDNRIKNGKQSSTFQIKTP